MGYQLAPGGSPWSPSLPVGIEGEPLHQYTAYQSTVTEAGVATAADFTSPNEPWMTSSHFPAATSSSMTNTTEGIGSLYAPMTPACYDEAERAFALQEYGLGLSVRAGETLTMGEDPVCAAHEGNRYY